MKKVIFVVMMVLMAGTGYGQGRKPISAVDVADSVDASSTLLGTWDSGSVKKDKLYPVGLMASYIGGALSSYLGLDGVLANSNTTGRTAIWQNGLNQTQVMPGSVQVFDAVGQGGYQATNVTVSNNDVGNYAYMDVSDTPMLGASDYAGNYKYHFAAPFLTSDRGLIIRDKNIVVAGLDDISTAVASVPVLDSNYNNAPGAYGNGTTVVTFNIDKYGRVLPGAATTIPCTSITLGSGLFYLGNSVNVATPTAISGDVTVSNAGVAVVDSSKFATKKDVQRKIDSLGANGGGLRYETLVASDANEDLSGIFALSSSYIVYVDLAATLTANRTLTLPATAIGNAGVQIIITDRNSGSFHWSIGGAALKDPTGTSITTLTNGTSYRIISNYGAGWWISY